MAPHYQEGASAPKAAPPAVVLDKDDGSPLLSREEMDRLARNDVISFYVQTLRKYNREVKGYSVTLQKQEFTNGKLWPTEVIAVQFRDKPHSVFFEWKQGVREGLRGADRLLFVDGENKNMLLCHPASKAARIFADVVSVPVDGADAKAGGRYTLDEFGLKKATERTLTDWRAAREANTLQVEFLGVKKVKEAGDRSCWTFRRTCKPDKDGVAEAMIYVDVENWLQVGNVLKDEKGNLLGAYYFRDVKLNPEFKKEQFTREALTQ
jgi:hypothetical protein